MVYFVQKSGDGQAFLPNDYYAQTQNGLVGKAVERLSRLEELHRSKVSEQETLSAKLGQLRLQGKEKSYQFRELMGKKLSNSIVIRALDEALADE